ncbi:MAG: 30S ribosomal protein S5 [Clostridia bacterium]|nr:30S ribosomal protein S5 [Clostridia bacterium]
MVATENKQERKEKTDRKPRRDNNRNQAPRVEDEFDKKMVAVNRISKTVKGGRKMRFNALVCVGNHKGKVGIGMGKATEVSLAIEKATVAAKKHVIDVAMNGTTIPHEVDGIFETTKIIMMPSKEGNGVIAGGAVRDVVELAGIRDITTKLYGSNNPVNCVKATFEGLKALKTAEQVAALRGVSSDTLK